MALLKIKCPECSAGLKSQAGFNIGQTVCCPKCETYFAVDEPEEGDEAPKKNSPVKGKPAAAKKPVKAAAAVDEDEEEEDEAPKKKKKKKKKHDDDDDEGGSYKNSPLRFIVLGVLVAVMLVLGYMLYDKKKKERESSGAGAAVPAVAAVAPGPPDVERSRPGRV